MELNIRRGTHQIGGSCVEVRSNNTRLILDVGLPLNIGSESAGKEAGEFFDQRSPESLKKYRPKVSGVFNDSSDSKLVDAVLLSHSHPDHSKFCDVVHPIIPIYMSAGTKAVMETLGMFLSEKAMTDNVIIIQTRPPQKYRIGDFEVEPFLVDHSAPDATAYFISTSDGKTMLYTGDFRAHGRKGTRGIFDSLIRKCRGKLDLLLMEGTMVGSGRIPQLSKSEDDLEKEIVQEIKKNKVWPLLANFSPTNLDRVITFIRACIQTDTILIVDLLTAYLYIEMKKLKWNIPDLEKSPLRILYFSGHADALSKQGHKDFLYKVVNKKIEPTDLKKAERRILLFRPTHLGNYLRWKLYFNNSTLINSQYEGSYPGQEKTMERFEKYLSHNNIRKVQFHTSGHAFEEDLKRFVDGIKPKAIIPIHTCHPEQYKSLFPDHNVIELNDGQEYNF